MSETSRRRGHRVSGKLLVRATLTNTRPLLMGKGAGIVSDAELMRLPDGTPYIPASSMAGCIKSRFYKLFGRMLDSTQHEHAEMFWGSEATRQSEASGHPVKTFQSHIIFDDLLPVGYDGKTNMDALAKKIVIRDGVKIDPKKGVAHEGGKYDYQLLEPGESFAFGAEITIRRGMNMEIFKQFVQGIKSTLCSEDFRIGALTSTGFGRMACPVFQAACFDFSRPEDRQAWFYYLQEKTWPTHLEKQYKGSIPLQQSANQVFCMTAGFAIKSSLIIGSYGIKPEDPDKSHLKSSGKPVLTGKSIKGALRHRALMILNALGCTQSEKFLKEMMGWVETTQLTDNNATSAGKSRLRIEEVTLQGVDDSYTQNRIRIDRFTGGTMSGGLFSSQPLWKRGDKKQLSLSLTLYDYNDWEVGLLLQLLKDLWLEDLAIGGEKNIGRGVLTGKEARLNFSGKEIKIESDGNTGKPLVSEENRQELERFNRALVEKAKTAQP